MMKIKTRDNRKIVKFCAAPADHERNKTYVRLIVVDPDSGKE